MSLRGVAAALGVALAAAAPAGAHVGQTDPWRAALAGAQAADGAATPQQVGDCGPGGLPETGLQGQVPKADQDSGRSLEGYRCNLRVIGQQDISSRGANFQMGWHRDCAYVGLVGGADAADPSRDPNHELDGLAVIDASDPAKPRLVGVLKSSAGRTHHEAIEVNSKRGMLVVQIGGLTAQWIEIYDVSEDCTKPVFKGRYDAGNPIYHGQRVSDDGRTIYATETFGLTGAGQVMHVIDVTDMTKPTLLLRWDPMLENPPGRYGIHDLEVNADGTRAYLGAGTPAALYGVFGNGAPSTQPGEPSVVVLDTTDVQERKPNPDLKVLGQVSMPNFGHALVRGRVDGKPYLFHGGESPFNGARACPWAWGSVIDISDERAPKAVSELKLEVNDAARCGETGPDNAGYSIHYNGVDDETNTHLAFFTYYTGGLRVFDVRNPAHPKEIAYFHTPPRPSTLFPPIAGNPAGDTQTPTWDSATSVIRYRPETGHIWFVSIGGGFQVAEFTGKYARPLGAVRLGRASRRSVLKRRSMRTQVSCTSACAVDLSLRVAGKLSAARRVELPEGGSTAVSLRLSSAAQRALRRSPGRATLTGAVRDGTVDLPVGRVRATRRLR